jgi:tetratricopeptide (TPR) repeat protein
MNASKKYTYVRNEGIVKVVVKTGILILVLLAFAPRSISQEPSDRVQQLYQAAKADEQAGHPDEAIQKYQQIIKLDPALAAGYNNLGRLLYQQGRLDEAIQPLRQASKLDPKAEPPRALLGFVQFQRADFEGAKREFKVASQLNPADYSVRLFLARSMVELKDFDAALEVLNKLLHDDPKNTEALYTLGGVYSSLAEITIGKIQTVDPNSYLLELLLAKVSEIKQLYPDAAEHYKRAIERAPDVPDLYYRYAHALWAAGDSQTAMTAYKNALQRNPYDYRSEWELARLLLADHPDEALRLTTHALELNPNLADALTIRGRALVALQKPKDAIADFRKAIAISPDDAAIHFQLARAYRLTGMSAEAQTENAIYERLDKEAHAARVQPNPPQ